jgi:hypothetical protein
MLQPTIEGMPMYFPTYYFNDTKSGEYILVEINICIFAKRYLCFIEVYKLRTSCPIHL